MVKLHANHGGVNKSPNKLICRGKLINMVICW